MEQEKKINWWKLLGEVVKVVIGFIAGSQL
jgi:hypothetical protein